MWRNNNLSIVLVLLFCLCVVGHAISGWKTYNQEQEEHGQSAVTLGQFLKTSEFGETIFENWESEFLQMAGFVILSAFLVQRGSAESKKPPDEAGEDEDEEQHLRSKGTAPWPVRKGGLWLALYNHSLSLALGLMFVGSFIIHLIGGHAVENEALSNHGEAQIDIFEFLGSPTFWFQSFQNWQSEFLSIGVLVVLTIFLRERGSPQSKPVDAPHRMTGPS